jgi:hypothetical protein
MATANTPIICTACGNDLQKSDDKPVKVLALPAEVRWQEAPNPRAALALVRKARAEGIKPKLEQVLCRPCARLAGLVVNPVARSRQ